MTPSQSNNKAKSCACKCWGGRDEDVDECPTKASVGTTNNDRQANAVRKDDLNMIDELLLDEIVVTIFLLISRSRSKHKTSRTRACRVGSSEHSRPQCVWYQVWEYTVVHSRLVQSLSSDLIGR
eukprot:scaffold451_cov184-Amphora_coffeaeformis.AAC.17